MYNSETDLRKILLHTYTHTKRQSTRIEKNHEYLCCVIVLVVVRAVVEEVSVVL